MRGEALGSAIMTRQAQVLRRAAAAAAELSEALAELAEVDEAPKEPSNRGAIRLRKGITISETDAALARDALKRAGSRR